MYEKWWSEIALGRFTCSEMQTIRRAAVECWILRDCVVYTSPFNHRST